MLVKSLKVQSVFLKKLFWFYRCNSTGVVASDLQDFYGEKFLTYSFILAGDLVKDAAVKEFDSCLEVTRSSLIPVFAIFKYHSLLKFDFLVDIVVWDKPGERFRFSILYCLLSTSLNSRFYVLCQTREGVPLESVIDLYESSSWLERECWDMYGVYFVNHNNFLRLLTDYGFQGHPLRKDFPLSGFVELFYDDCSSGVVYEPVELVQEYRNFQFKSPWAEDVTVSRYDEEEGLEIFNFQEETEKDDNAI